MRSVSHLPTAIIDKLTVNDKIAPLFIAAHSEDEEIEEVVVELACGHIVRKKDDSQPSTIRFNLSISNHLANLSIFEASRCSVCEFQLRANKDVGSERHSSIAALQVAEKHKTSDQKRKLCGLEGRSTDDEESREEHADEELRKPSTDGRLDVSFGETVVRAYRRAKKALVVQGAVGSGVEYGGA